MVILKFDSLLQGSSIQTYERNISVGINLSKFWTLKQLGLTVPIYQYFVETLIIIWSPHLGDLSWKEMHSINQILHPIYV